MSDDGYIKYHFDLQNQSLEMEQDLIDEINYWRSQLLQKSWIGQYPDGIGFGNISCRLQKDTFYISGTATGGRDVLYKEQIVLVNSFSIEKNYISCIGDIAASSESLSHAALYESDKSIMNIIHIHSKLLWEKHKNKLTTSSPSIAYGTPQMARTLQYCKTQIQADSGVIIMGGHDDGIIAYGTSFRQVFQLLVQL